METQLQSVLPQIEKTAGPCAVIVFGYNSINGQSKSAFGFESVPPHANGHFYLLVFTNESTNALTNLTDSISQRSDGKISVTLLQHTLQSLGTKSQDQRWFFYQALRLGEPVSLGIDVPYLRNYGWVRRDYEGARTHWYKCEAMAGLYLESAAQSQHLDVELGKIAFLSQAIEFIALGLIRVFLGYTPNQYGLKFLLALCGHFTDLPSHCFPIADEVGQKRLKMVCTPPSMLRHWDKLEAPEADFDSLLDACTRFFGKSRKLALKHLETLENLRTKTSIS
ncbi:hypothetical protein HUK80_17375 [Flavobacterium sp. MAH-1]|uniref:HEPN domain-containing protein n=1 Tax=Flavobacterium agri TaxID=2743471 RepID=A0A7Y8Y5E5_9FLAO|nr:hypothetical protein [Flavobacterium agri]NUY82677.1 hypothetical protein [Flavobacterium agri]NYA72700.1 hypothetical protein [Flavobacterium agri]